MNRGPSIFFFAFIVALQLGAQQNEDCSCCSVMQRAFDFWVGKWEVYLADGKMAGVNQIVKGQDGCVLRENWISTNDSMTGTSLNYYNQTTKKWEQIWIDNRGNLLKLQGEYTNGQMVLSSEPFKGAGGKNSVNRITWMPLEDGRVRQLWEVLQDGVVIRVLFDGFYQRM